MKHIKTTIMSLIINAKFIIAHINANKSNIISILIVVIIFPIIAIPLIIIFLFKIIKIMLEIYRSKKELRFHVAANIAAHEIWNEYSMR